MFSSKADEVGGEDLTQDILEQRIINRFDYYTTQGGPQRGAVILRFLGFGVVTLVGIDPEVAPSRRHSCRDCSQLISHTS